MIGIPLGLVVANATEWVVHKYVLHGLGANKKSYWSFHWHEHHNNARRHGHRDPTYERSLLGWHAQTKEALALAAGGVLVAPLFPVAPFFVGTLMYSAVHYYRVHKRAHLDPEWARENLPWHYDHHMGPNQDANWCVTRPWFDHLMGTRIPFVGSELEEKAHARRERKAAVRPATASPASAA